MAKDVTPLQDPFNVNKKLEEIMMKTTFFEML
jgi:hypothetical protein